MNSFFEPSADLAVKMNAEASAVIQTPIIMGVRGANILEADGMLYCYEQNLV